MDRSKDLRCISRLRQATRICRSRILAQLRHEWFHLLGPDGGASSHSAPPSNEKPPLWRVGTFRVKPWGSATVFIVFLRDPMKYAVGAFDRIGPLLYDRKTGFAV